MSCGVFEGSEFDGQESLTAKSHSGREHGSEPEDAATLTAHTGVTQDGAAPDPHH